MIQKDIINDFLRKVYFWTAIGLVLSGLSAVYAVTSPALLEIITSGWLFLLIIIELGLVIAISWAINKISKTTAAALFVLYSIITGITLAFIFLIYTLSSIAIVFFLTSAIFFLMSFIGYATKKDLSSLGTILFAGLIGVVIAMLVNLFLKNEALMIILSILAVIIFTGLILYDTQKLKKMALTAGKNAGKYAIVGALSLYLDFINLFLNLLRLFGKRK